jgi:hypothetical protein
MEVKPKKVVRFDALVKLSGQAQQVTLWVKPQEDREFMRAVKQNRVVTVVQRNVGTKKDYGLVGFFQRPKAGYLVFPKALPYPAETKVVGIKYARVAERETGGPVYKTRRERDPGIPMREAPSKRQAPARKLRREPQRFEFRSDVQLAAVQRIAIVIRARSAREAAQLARKQAALLPMDLKRATLSRTVSRPVRRQINPCARCAIKQ